MSATTLPHDRARRSDDLVGAKSTSLAAPKVSGRPYYRVARRRTPRAPVFTLN